MTQINCCDGCQRGLPVNKHGNHYAPGEIFGCTRARYRLTLEPKERDAWYQPGKRKRNRGPFVCGGGV